MRVLPLGGGLDSDARRLIGLWFPSITKIRATLSRDSGAFSSPGLFTEERVSSNSRGFIILTFFYLDMP